MKLEVLVNAIMNAHLEQNVEIDLEAAREISWTVLSHFGYGNVCLGNRLEVDERELFYELEDLDILKSTSKMESLNGQYGTSRYGGQWRIFQWELNEKRILQLQHVVFIREIEGEEALYNGLPEDAFIPGRNLEGRILDMVLDPRIEKKWTRRDTSE